MCAVLRVTDNFVWWCANNEFCDGTHHHFKPMPKAEQ